MGFRSVVAAVVAAVALFGCEGGCRGYSNRPFPLEVGYEPLEPCRAEFPAPVEGDPHPEALQTVQGHGDGWVYAHGAAYLHVPLEAVWAALQDPAVSRIHGPSWAVTWNVEPFPLSYAIRYTDGNAFVTVHWTIVTRGGPVGELQPPQEYGVRYQRTEGTDYVKVQDGSLVATDAGDGVTALQLVCHLNAYDQGPDNVRGTVQDWFDDLRAKVHAGASP